MPFLAEPGWGFILLYLIGGPLLAGLALALVTAWLPARARTAFDRAALLGLPLVLVLVAATWRRSGGLSLLFALPYGLALVSLIATRLAWPPRPGASRAPRGPDGGGAGPHRL